MLAHLGRKDHLESQYTQVIRRRRQLNATTLFLFATLVGLLVGAGMLVHHFAVSRDAASERAALNYQIRELQQIANLLHEAETGQRGYLLTNRRRYLEPYERAVRELPALLRAVASDVDATARSRIEEISRTSDRKLEELAETIRMHERGDHAAALDLIQTDRGQLYMEQIRAQILALTEQLDRKRDVAEAQVLASMYAVKRWTFVTLGSLLLSIGMFAIQIRGLTVSRNSYEAKLATQSSMLNAVIDEIPAMVAIWDLDLSYCLVNKQFERWRKKSRTEVIGKTVAEVTTPFEYERSRPHIERALRGETVTYEKEYPNDTEITHVVSTYSPLILEDGQVGGIVALAHDITRQHAERVRLKLLSERDELTSLMNRAGFEAFLATACTTSLGTMLGLIYIDLDEFKPVNDRYGHAAGDEVLRIFAQRLQQIVRPTDGIARLGGDEFAIVLLGLRNENDARKVADKIVAMAKQPMLALAHSIQISASVGVAFDGSLDLGWRGLIGRADRMVYDAKLSGRGCSSVETDWHRSKA